MPGEDWLDINMMQSGHGDGHDVKVWDMVTRDRRAMPKPTLDGEPNYEDHPVNPWPTWDPANGYYDDYDVRKQCYRSVFAGACGVTYGHHSVWQFYSAREAVINHAKMYWTEAINRPGATQVGYLRRLMESRPMLGRVPDSTMIMQGQGLKGEHIEAFRGAGGSYGMVYLPVGKTVRISTAVIKGKKIKAWWFNPKDASVQRIGIMRNAGAQDFTPPATGVGNDWVLIMDDATAGYPSPGKL